LVLEVGNIEVVRRDYLPIFGGLGKPNMVKTWRQPEKEGMAITSSLVKISWDHTHGSRNEADKDVLERARVLKPTWRCAWGHSIWKLE
jgi:hypothetical protein